MKHQIETEPQTSLDQVDVFFVRWVTIMFGMLIFCTLLWYAFPDLDWASGLMLIAIVIPPVIFFRNEMVELIQGWIWYLMGKKPKETIEE